MTVNGILLTATNEKDLNKELVKLSLENKGKAVLVNVTFGTARAYIYPSLSRIPLDQPATRFMLQCYKGIAFVDGKLTAPTAAWAKRRTAYDNRTWGRD